MENTPKLKTGKKDRHRLSIDEIYQYATSRQYYLIPHSYNTTNYRVKVGNPPKTGAKEIHHNLRFWRGKFSFNDGKEVWRLEDPRSASFLESLKKFKLPDVLKGDEEDVLHVIQIIRGDKGLSERKRYMEREEAKIRLYEDSKEHMTDDDDPIYSDDDIYKEQTSSTTSSTTQNTSVPEECDEKDFLSSSDWDSDEYD